MRVSESIANLSDIQDRSHADLQDLTADDHPQYRMGKGLLSARPASGTEGQRYWATDTGIIYRYNGSSWDEISALNFSDLDDVELNYSGKGGYYLKIKSDETGIESESGSLSPAYATGSKTLLDMSTIGNLYVASYTVIKSGTIGARGGSIKVDFKLGIDGGASLAYGRVYRNGSPVGTERTSTSGSGELFSEVISGWSPGDSLEIYVKRDGGSGSAFVQDAYAYVNFLSSPEVTLNTGWS